MKKNAFTLVELLAVIAILSIIMLISIPSLINQLNTSKEDALEKSKEIIIGAAKNYVIDNDFILPKHISITELCNSDYLTCPIENPLDNTNLDGYVYVDSNKNYSYLTEYTENMRTITVELDGGSTTQSFPLNYPEGERVILKTPTKTNYKFSRWTTTSGTIINNTLTVGNSNATLTAHWNLNKYRLTVNLDGGSTTQVFKNKYEIGEEITLINPTKTGYVFNGWTVGGEPVNGNILTMGNGDMTLIATWTVPIEINFPTNDNEIEDYYIFEVLENGYYKIELWGAQGADYDTTYIGGKGAYTSGTIYLESGEMLYLYIGSAGNGVTAGYNGGGSGIWVGSYKGHAGGGATDVRYFGDITPTASELEWNSPIGLNSRIMVAAGGGGAGYHTTPYYSSGGNGGGLIGIAGTSTHSSSSNLANAGGTQINGGYNSYNASYINVTRGSFGIGGSGALSSSSGTSGGGSGYYGGSGGPEGLQPGAGGSSYISGHAGCVAVAEGSVSEPRATRTDSTGQTLCSSASSSKYNASGYNTDQICSVHYSLKEFDETSMIDGSGQKWEIVDDALVNTTMQMLNPDGGTMIGRSGDGYARITYIGL